MFDDDNEIDELVPVKIVSRHGGSMLLEWIDHYGLTRRGYLPLSVVQDDHVTEKELSASHPYGIPWSEIITLHATPELIGERLHKVGIWTLDDLLGNPQAAIGALQSVYMMDYAKLRMAARNLGQGDK